MPDFLYILRPTRSEMLADGPTEREAEVVGRHFDYLQELHQQGTVILVGRTQEDNAATIGLCIYRATTEDEARALLAADPAVAEGVMTGELRSFKIALGPAENQ